MNSLPKTVTRQRRGCDLNPGPSAPESSTLTTRLPSDPLKCTAQISTTADPAMFRKLLKILLCSRCKHWLTVLRYFGIRWLTRKKTDTRTISVVHDLKVLHRRLCDTTIEVELVGLSVYGTTHTHLITETTQIGLSAGKIGSILRTKLRMHLQIIIIIYIYFASAAVAVDSIHFLRLFATQVDI